MTNRFVVESPRARADVAAFENLAAPGIGSPGRTRSKAPLLAQSWPGSTRLEALAWAIASIALLVFVLILRARLDGSSLRVLAALAVLCSALGLISSHRLYRTRESSASFLYILLFSLFNLGLAPFFLFNSTVPTLGQSIYVTNWEMNGAFRDALILSTAGLLALIAGTSSGTAFGQRFLLPSSRTTPLKVASDEAISDALGIPALVLLVCMVIAFFAVGYSAGGFHIFIAGYTNWNQLTANSALPYVYAGIGLAVAMIAVASPSPARRLGFMVFILYGVIVLLIGIRTEVLFPLASAIVLVGYSRQYLSGKRMLVIVVVGLCLISGVRSFRSSGLVGQVSGSAVAIGPQDGLAELGSTLRPLVVILNLQQNGQPPLHGGSFTDPFSRLVHRLLPFSGPNRSANSDPDLLNVVIGKVAGPIGFSPTAEGYDNFGAMGIAGFLFAIGLALSWVDRSPRNPRSELYRAAVMIPIFIEVRNAFTPVPFQILFGLVLVYCSLLAARSLARSP